MENFKKYVGFGAVILLAAGVGAVLYANNVTDSKVKFNVIVTGFFLAGMGAGIIANKVNG